MTKLPQYVQPIKAGGKTYHYLRFRGVSIKLPDPSETGFKAAYKNALAQAKAAAEAVAAGHASAKAKKTEAAEQGSVRAALDAYLLDGIAVNKRDGSRVAPNTVTSRRQTLEAWCGQLTKKFGTVVLADIKADDIEEWIKGLAKHGANGAARSMRTSLRSFFDWAKTKKLIEADPSVVLNVRLPKSSDDGFLQWDAETVAKYLAKHQPGSKARYVYDLFYSSGAACVDLCRLTTRNIVDGCWEYSRGKSGEDACKPISAEMMASIDNYLAGQNSNVVALNRPLLVNTLGRPYNAKQLGTQMRAWVAEAGIARPEGSKLGYSAHGIRKQACCDDLDRGDCSFDELMAMYGWSTASMVTHYGKKYARRNAARRVAKRRAAAAV